MIVLYGSKDDLCSYNCLKILWVAFKTNTKIEIECIEDVSTLSVPLAKTFVLYVDQGIKKFKIGGDVSTILRTISKLAPGYELYPDEKDSLVDSWISYCKRNLELPFESLKICEEESSKSIMKDVDGALNVLNNHLYMYTYMVGESVTLADMNLVCILDGMTTSYEKEMSQNVKRLYDTCINQKCFKLAKKTMTSLCSKEGSSIKAKVNAIDEGVSFAGVAPAVVPKLYKRNRIRIKEVEAYLNEDVTVSGWCRTTRNASKGTILFIELNDGSTNSSLQCVLEKESTEDFDVCKNSGGAGASFEFFGKVIPSPAKGQAVELQVQKGKLLGAVYGGDQEGKTIGAKLYPMSKKSHTLEFMRDNAHLRPRAKVHSAAMRIRHAMAFATHKFFNDNGFLYIHTPIITCADCEGAGEQFGVTTLLGKDHTSTDIELPKLEKLSKSAEKKLKKMKQKYVQERVVGALDYNQDFFSRRANLTVSGQLNVETHACALSDVYTFGPTFRAENSHTARHLAEFWMIEPEIAFATLEDDLNLAEDYLKYCVHYALEMCSEDLEFFEKSPYGEVGLRNRLENVLEKPFVRITYTEAIQILEKAVADNQVKFEEAPSWGIDLPTEMERYLCETIYKQPVVITNYPKEIKAFYMKLNNDGKTVAAADVLVPKIGEIIGGSQREHRLDVLTERCIESGLDPASIWWYCDLRRYGTVPHAGFGLGFERLILFITGLDNIRDVIPFPRWPGNAEF